MYFNPLPRKRENHLIVKWVHIRSGISIHSLVRGRTAAPETYQTRELYFNPLPRKRENIDNNISKAELLNFNPLPRKREN